MDAKIMYRRGLNLTENPEQQDFSKTSNSASGLMSTLVPALASAGIMVLVFTILRRSQRRQYIPRSYIGCLREQERTPAPSPGLLGWIVSMAKLPDTYVLRHHSMDAYLLLRYLKIISVICFVGCLMIWPVLFPINATGGGGKTQLDTLTLSNVVDTNRYYAHAIMAWLFVGFVFYMITRELVFFINLRQAYFLSPLYASRISSKTVLFMAVPNEYLTKDKIRKIYGEDKVKNVWLVTNTEDLDELVSERKDAAMKLEDAETALVVKANAGRLKAKKLKEKSDTFGNPAVIPEDSSSDKEIADESGSVAARWVKPSERPAHRLGWLGIGKKVDTIDWASKEIGKLTPAIEELQAKHKAGEAPLISAV
ncbi:Adaptor for signal transduction, partial [Ascosphaera pollenicola]